MSIFRFTLVWIFCSYAILATEKNPEKSQKTSIKDQHKDKSPNIPSKPKSVSRMEYDRLENKEYISLTRFKEIAKNSKIDLDPLLLTVNVIHGKKKVRFQVDSKFYAGDGEIYPLDYAPVYHKNDVYMPRQLVEELFTELGLTIRYKFEEKNVAVQEDEKKVNSGGGLDFIVIDPGHGGKDPGAFGVSSVMEKKITLEVSTYVSEFLKQEFPGVKIYMTRNRDNFVSLEKRSDIANEKLKKDNFGIFISFHCNSTLAQSVHGYEIFYLSQNPGSEEDRKVMMRENDLVSTGDPEIGMIESYLLNSQILAESKMLARQLNRTLMTQLSGHVSSRGVRKADFRVLRKSLMPAVLVEMGYISNSGEASVLQTGEYKKKLSGALSAGIKNFIKYRPKM